MNQAPELQFALNLLEGQEELLIESTMQLASTLKSVQNAMETVTTSRRVLQKLLAELTGVIVIVEPCDGDDDYR